MAPTEDTPARPAQCAVSVVWDDRFLEYDFGPDHPFTEESRRLSVTLLRARDQFSPERLHEIGDIAPASESLLRAFHRMDYIARIAAVSVLDDPPMLDGGDTPSFTGCYEASARLVGGTLRALQVVREDPKHHAVQPGGGLHHAAPERASGFCIFNDLAVAIAVALRERWYRRIAYIDIDAHHGDGVLYGFRSDPRLLVFDVHQDGRTLFPGTGAATEMGDGEARGTKFNVPLAPGAGDRELAEIADRVLPDALEAFRPELIVLQHGVDGHAGDPLAQLQYTRVGYGRVLNVVHDAAHALCGGRLLVTGGGGYAPASVSRVLAEVPVRLSSREETWTNADVLPAPWRHEFKARLGRDAPEILGPGAAPRADPTAWAALERTFEELERAHGRAFRRRSAG
jgi:acetoin utilization protein AcuC